jgi:hypothetical protein
MKICDCCFNDPEIKGFIQSSSIVLDTCPICGKEAFLIELEELEDFFRDFFAIFQYDQINGKPLIDLIQEDWDMFTSREYGANIIGNLSFIIDLTLQLGLSSSDPSTNSELKMSYIDEIQDSVDYWEELKADLKHKRRFLTDLTNLEDYGWDAAFNVFSTIDSSVILYRSRINVDGTTSPYPNCEMSSPPQVISTAGRANPQGIPYLYLSRDLKTTLYESRATFLDYVSIGHFKVDDGFIFKVVDFTIEESPFNNIDNIINFTKGRFIRRVISRDLSRPLSRYDSELEYIPTQFICEYIRFFTNPAIGIQFRSSLDKNGVNIVLFDEDKIKCIDVEIHQITKIDIDSISLL